MLKWLKRGSWCILNCRVTVFGAKSFVESVWTYELHMRKVETEKRPVALQRGYVSVEPLTCSFWIGSQTLVANKLEWKADESRWRLLEIRRENCRVLREFTNKQVTIKHLESKGKIELFFSFCPKRSSMTPHTPRMLGLRAVYTTQTQHKQVSKFGIFVSPTNVAAAHSHSE